MSTPSLVDTRSSLAIENKVCIEIGNEKGK